MESATKSTETVTQAMAGDLDACNARLDSQTQRLQGIADRLVGGGTPEPASSQPEQPPRVGGGSISSIDDQIRMLQQGISRLSDQIERLGNL